ncbi:hypothetical protein [Pseudomonas veronii]|uniref:Uncharacterized protein n=1 Tax=Pseudomonas veronii TaxID=76761 RepID=A0A5M8EP44_PSEVE|nr:hypothetical protein [Pseudomonas veronii]KAA6173355.1 hypothetical protein F3K54_19050 [Pseudomonas veronii]KAA6174427.1 hypothetical protein F3K53_21780 [Pseudomonas veronii]
MNIHCQPMNIGMATTPHQRETGSTLSKDDSNPLPLASGDEKLTQFKPTAATAGRPMNDDRGAAQIYDANPIIQRFFDTLQSLPDGGHNILKHLKNHLGDWTANNRNVTSRADATFNLARLLNYLDKNINLYRTNEALNPSEANNLTGNEDYHPRSEFAGLMKFVLYGYSSLPDVHPTPLTEWSLIESTTELKNNASAFPNAEEKRPPLDRRSAFEIYEQHNIVDFVGSHKQKDLSEREQLLGRLKWVVGNLRSDNPSQEAQADATYRLARVTEFLNSKIKPDKSNWETIKDTFIAFSHQGYPALEKYRYSDSYGPKGAQDNIPPKDTPLPPTTAGASNRPDGKSQFDFIETEKDTFSVPTHATGRPEGDTRTADQIIKANPIFNYLPRSIPVKNLYTHLGDWSINNPDPKQRADAAYNAAQVLNSIDARGLKNSGNGRINGEYVSFLPPPFDGAQIDDNDGSEAALLKKFSEKGYSALTE